ncbi:MAG: hypothetical protein WCW62_14265 [Bacteroidales bacterium]
MKTKIIFISLFFWVMFSAKGQENIKQQQTFVEIFSTGFDFSPVVIPIRPEGRYSDIKGSPYLSDQWADGSIMLINDTDSAGFRMRYNVYGNEMQFIHDADTMAIANPLKLNAVWLNGRRFEYLPFILNKNENMAYFEIITEGKIKLLVRHSIRLESGMDPVTPYHCQNSTDRFVAGKFYYYQTVGMEKPEELPLGKGAFLSLPPFNRPEVKEFIHERKIRLQKQDDLRVLFTWINQTTTDK